MKIHLDIRDGINPVIALKCVESVLRDEKSYYPTEFDTTEGKVWVSLCLYRKSDCFIVYKNKG